MANTQTRKILHIIGGEKGGVGKSMLARLLCEYYLSNDDRFAGFDGDASNPSLSRFYAPYVNRVDMLAQEQLDQTIDSVLDDDAHTIVDLPAQSFKALSIWWESNDIVSFCKAHRIPIYVWWVCDDSFDSMKLAESFLHNYSKQIKNTILVKNLGRGSDFSAFDHFEPTAKAKHTFYLPKIERRLLYPIDQHSLSFSAATDQNSPLSTIQRNEIALTLETIFCIFDATLRPSAKRTLKLNLKELLAIQSLLDDCVMP